MRQRRPIPPAPSSTRLWYLFSGVLIVVVALVSGAALTSGSAQAQAQASPPTLSTPPTISGATVVGQTLTASSGSWSGDAPITFAYQWRRCDTNGANCVDVAGADGPTRVLGAADVGFTLRIQVTASNSAGSAVAQSAPTGVVASSSVPVNTAEPVVSGTPLVGQTLTATTGTWTSTTPISYAYQWVRCGTDGGAPDGSNCQVIAGATASSYVLKSEDAGRRMRVRVSARNATGTQTVASNATSTVSAGAPVNTREPAISGTPTQGQTLSAKSGAWIGEQPFSFAYQWVRCGTNGGAADGSNCVFIAGATAPRYTLQSSDVGSRMRVRVTARNGRGSTTVASNPTAAVQSSAPPLPPGAIKLANGRISIPASSVSLPARLVIDGIQFTPNPVRSRQIPIQLRVHVSDTRGYVVRGVLIMARSTPLLTTTAARVPTGQDGWVSLQVMPRASFPLRRGYNVQFFVRARKDGDNVLAGVSTRRLVQVRTAP